MCDCAALLDLIIIDSTQEISTSMENRIRADFDSSLGEGGGFSFENFVDWPPLSWSGSTAGPKTR